MIKIIISLILFYILAFSPIISGGNNYYTWFFSYKSVILADSNNSSNSTKENSVNHNEILGGNEKADSESVHWFIKAIVVAIITLLVGGVSAFIKKKWSNIIKWINSLKPENVSKEEIYLDNHLDGSDVKEVQLRKLFEISSDFKNGNISFDEFIRTLDATKACRYIDSKNKFIILTNHFLAHGSAINLCESVSKILCLKLNNTTSLDHIFRFDDNDDQKQDTPNQHFISYVKNYIPSVPIINGKTYHFADKDVENIAFGSKILIVEVFLDLDNENKVEHVLKSLKLNKKIEIVGFISLFRTHDFNTEIIDDSIEGNFYCPFIFKKEA